MSAAEMLALVAGLRQGDPDAFDCAYAAYHRRVYSFLLRLCPGRPDAEDVFQDTFLQLARYARSLRPDTDLMAWLYTVARNGARRRRRTLARQPEAPLTDAMNADAAPGPDEQAAGQAALRQIEAALQRLSPDHREVLLLLAVEGLAHEQAAAVLGLRPDAVRKRLSRARAELAALLEERQQVRMKDDMSNQGGRS